MFGSKKNKDEEDLQQQLKSKDAEIAYLEAQLKKKDDEISKLKAGRGGGGLPGDSVQHYEQIIDGLNKKIQYLEGVANQDGVNIDLIAFNKFNQNIRDRFLFIERILDWNTFAQDVKENKVGHRNNWKNKEGNPQLHEEVNAKQHFAAQKSCLHEILEDVYFPVIDPQEHENMYSRFDMAVKQQHSKFVDSLVIELMALTQVLHGLNDSNEPAQLHMEDKYGNTVKDDKKAADAKSGNAPASPSKGPLYARPNISMNQRMVIAGLMKRLISQIPIKMSGQNSLTVGKCKDFGKAVSNLHVLIKKRTSVRPVFGTTFSVDMSETEMHVQNLVDSFMHTIVDYDAHCEKEEKEVPERIEKEQLDIYNSIQNKINGAVANKLRRNQGLVQLQNNIKPVHGAPQNFGGYAQPPVMAQASQQK